MSERRDVALSRIVTGAQWQQVKAEMREDGVQALADAQTTQQQREAANDIRALERLFQALEQGARSEARKQQKMGVV